MRQYKVRRKSDQKYFAGSHWRPTWSKGGKIYLNKTAAEEVVGMFTDRDNVEIVEFKVTEAVVYPGTSFSVLAGPKQKTM